MKIKKPSNFKSELENDPDYGFAATLIDRGAEVEIWPKSTVVSFLLDQEDERNEMEKLAHWMLDVLKWSENK